MALPGGAGANLLLSWNPASQRAVLTWSKGNPAFGDDMAEVVLSLLLEDEGWSTGGRRRGPSLRSVRMDDRQAESKLKAYAEQRLDIALRDGRLRSIDIQPQRVRKGTISLYVGYVTRSGKKNMIEVSLGNLGSTS